ncbi:MAG TPA: hypothetical protein VE090_06385 [Methylomirabilota bacterium]|nr:hypothetical protein [Methylomirabilota bacterium]
MPDNLQLQNSQQQDENLDQELNEVAQTTKQKIQQDPTLSQSLATDPTLQDTIVDIEKELLSEIIKRLDQEKMSPEEAQSLAKEFLSLLPIQDQKDLLNKLYKLSQDNRATQGIYLKYAKPHEENETQKKLELMSQHIQQGNIEEALSIAKGKTTNA